MTERRRDHRVRRIAVRVVVFLLLGAIVNVLACWVLAVRPTPSVTVYEHTPNHPGRMLSATYVEPAFGELCVSQGQGGLFTSWLDDTIEISEDGFTSILPSGSAFHDRHPALNSPENSGSDEVIYYAEFAFGWPMLAMRYTYERRVHVEEAESDSIQLPAGLAQWLEQKEYRSELPRCVIPVSFAVNAVFYSTILWLLFAGPGRVRRWRRTRRGLCAKCAYPVGASDVCTECGAALKPKAA